MVAGTPVRGPAFATSHGAGLVRNWTRTGSHLFGGVRKSCLPLPVPERDQVGEQPVSAGYTVRQLTEEGEAGVDVVAVAVGCDEQ